MRVLLSSLLGLCVLLGCSEPVRVGEADGGTDAGGSDAGEDVGPRDASAPDTGASDSGSTPGEDAGAADAGCSPGSTGTAETFCNGVDDDCDGAVDEGFVDAAGDVVVIGASCDGPDEGLCGASGTTDSSPGVWICPFDQTGPATCNEPDVDDLEVCDASGADEDCDGVVDEFAVGDGGPVAERGDACIQGGASSDVAPACGGTYECASASSLGCVATSTTGAETCNGLDDDCDGMVDEGLAELGAAETATACADAPCGAPTAACVDGSATCTSSASGASWARRAYWADGDEDGYAPSGAATMQFCSTNATGSLRPAATQPGGASVPNGVNRWTWRNPSSSSTRDCCDSDGRAHPTRGTWHGAPHACGSFDYNCDGREDPEYSNQCYMARNCDGSGGQLGWDPADSNVVDCRVFCGSSAGRVLRQGNCLEVVPSERRDQRCH